MKTWQKPLLIVLVRSNPEETVLTACKVSAPSTTPTNQYPGCAFYTQAVGGCADCSDWGSS
jgi:hypothetical protein